MGRKITLEFELPSWADLQTRLHGRRVTPTDSPVQVLRRFSNAMFMLNMLMALALLTSSGMNDPQNPVASGSIWRILYAGAFGVAALLGAFHFFASQNFSPKLEMRYRMVMFGLAFIAALGWFLITTATAIFLGTDWTRPVPWVFILFYLTRIFRTYAVYLDEGTIEKVRRNLPDA